LTVSGTDLQAADLEKLAACGISPELAQQALLRRVTSQEGSGIIGRNDACRGIFEITSATARLFLSITAPHQN
jgi:hypothetical protein